MLISCVIIIIVLSLICYYYFKSAFQYWNKLGIPFPKPSFPFGNCIDLIKRNHSIGECLTKFYNEMKRNGHKHFGIYFLHKPVYVPIDPELIKHILIKDFQYFHDRGIYYNPENDPLSAHLFALRGTEWRNLRSKLTSAFTVAKLKIVTKFLVEFSQVLNQNVNELLSMNESIDVNQLLVKYNCNVTGSYVFGVNCENPEFIEMGQQVFRPKLIDGMKHLLAVVYPNVSKLIKLSVTNTKVDNFFRTLIKDIIQYRLNKNVIRNDFMQLVMNLLKNKTLVNLDAASAHSFLFFIAGYETSSSAATFCLYELAKNPDIQQKLRQEIFKVLERNHNQFTYESLNEMFYMDNVIKESLRKYPPIMFLQRVVTKPYKIPGTEIVLEKGCIVFIPVHGMHMDPEYFPEPDNFDPNRFSMENQSMRSEYVYLPFGKGPRNCIGERFGIFQVKVALAQLLINYKFSLQSNMLSAPLHFDPQSLVMKTKHKIRLIIDKICDVNT